MSANRGGGEASLSSQARSTDSLESTAPPASAATRRSVRAPGALMLSRAYPGSERPCWTAERATVFETGALLGCPPRRIRQDGLEALIDAGAVGRAAARDRREPAARGPEFDLLRRGDAVLVEEPAPVPVQLVLPDTRGQLAEEVEPSSADRRRSVSANVISPSGGNTRPRSTTVSSGGLREAEPISQAHMARDSYSYNPSPPHRRHCAPRRGSFGSTRAPSGGLIDPWSARRNSPPNLSATERIDDRAAHRPPSPASEEE